MPREDDILCSGAAVQDTDKFGEGPATLQTCQTLLLVTSCCPTNYLLRKQTVSSLSFMNSLGYFQGTPEFLLTEPTPVTWSDVTLFHGLNIDTNH